MANMLQDFFSGGNADKAEKATKKAVDQFDIGLPSVEDQALNLEQLVQQGVLTPEEAQVILQKDSALNDITLDPKLQQAQMDALASLQDIGQNKGLTDMDRAQLAQIESQENAASRGQREAIIQNAQARGLGGSGIELLSQMQNQQDAATRKSARDTDVAGMAQARALQALQQAGSLGGQIQQADFGRQAEVARANDAIAQFNTQTQNQNSAANTLARNQAAAANLAEQQRVADQSAGIRNQQQQANKSLYQTDFDNKAKLAGGKSGAYQNQAAGFNQQGQQNQQLIGTGIQAAATYYGGKGKKEGGLIEGEPSESDSVYQFLQPGEVVIKKDDVPDMLKKAHTSDDGEFDAAGFIDTLTGGKYNYSNKKKRV